MKNIFRSPVLILISGLSLALISCGGKGGGQPLNAAQAGMVLGQLKAVLQKLPQSNTLSVLPVPGVTTSSVNDCETVTPASTIDLDNDGIAAYKKYTYNCTNISSGGFLRTQKGTIEIKDLDETIQDVFGGVRIDFDVPVYKSTNATNTYEYSYEGFWLYQNVGGNLVSTSDFSAKNKYNAHGFENDYTSAYTWEYKMIPESAVAPFQSGAVEITGDFELRGKFVRDINGTAGQDSGSWALTYRSENLTYLNSCPKYYKTGAYVINDGQNKIEIRYACTTAKLFVNGAESDWWVP